MFKIHIARKLLSRGFALPAWCLMIVFLTGCVTSKSAISQKSDLKIQTSPAEAEAECKLIFDKGVSAFEENNLQLAQMNFAQVIDIEQNLLAKPHSDPAQEYLNQIQAAEPSILPEQIFTKEDLEIGRAHV